MQRKWIVALSLFSTILFIVAFIIAEFLLGVTLWWAMILVFILFVSLLYSLSKFVIMPLYAQLVLQIFQMVANDRMKLLQCKKSRQVISDFYYLFNKDEVTIFNHFFMQLEWVDLDFYDFHLDIKKRKEKNCNMIYGRVLSFQFQESFFENFIFILENKKESEKFKNYYEKKYQNQNHSISYGKKYRHYTCYYNHQYEEEILSVLNEPTNFHALKAEGNCLQIFLHQKEDGFHFKLQNALQDDVLIHCKEKYADLFKIIEQLKEYIRKKGGEEHVQ